MVQLVPRVVKGETSAQQARRVREKVVSSKWQGIAVTKPSRGFSNRSAYHCYRNSMVQVLMHTPKFLNFLAEIHPASECTYTPSAHCVACTLRELASRYWHGSGKNRLESGLKDLNTACENTSSAILAPWDRPGQQDVAEYWTFLRNAILLRLSDEQSDVFDAIFSSGIKNSRTCRQCSDESDRWDMRETLMLPLAHATKEHRLGEYIDSVFSANLLEARSCPNCGQVNTTFEKDVIEKPPHTLVVHLVRIAYKEISGQYTETKIIDRVDFPERLDLSRHVAEPSVRPVLYELKAAVHHQHLMGRRAANGEYIVRNDQGHYKASVHGPDGRWREVEDDLVRGDITFRDVLNPGLRWTPSILVYERMAQPTGSSSAPVDLTEAVVPTQTVAPATHTAPATNGATTKGKATLARKKAADATQGGRVTSARKKAAAKALATGTATTTITTKKAKKGRARQTREKVELY